ncbi:putative reverse transcriptase domain-containing protein [Tanacetum coccineum]
MQGTPYATDVAGLSQRMIDFATTIRQDTYEIYGRLDDAQDDRLLMSGQLNMLRRDRCAHACTARLMETETILSREAWVQSMDASDTGRSKVRALQTVLAYQTEIEELRAADRRRQTQLTEKMAPKKTTRSTPATTTTPTTSVTDEQLKRLIDQGVTDALVARDIDRSRNGEDNHDSGTGIRRQAPPAREYTDPDGIHEMMFPEESDKIEKYVDGLPDMIYRSQKPTCYECGAQEHFKRECPKLKNNNCGNQGGNDNAPAKVYTVGRVGTNPDSNVVTGTFLLKNCYAFVLFDTGADRSFVSTVFISQIDIIPSTLDHYYDVELADRRIIGLNAIIRGCTLNFLNHPFNIDLMPVELGSFDVIIGMDWLAKYQAIIV